MSVSFTSIKAYYEELPNFSARQKQILTALASFGNLSNRELSKKTGLEINVITARTNELVKAGKVTAYGKKIDSVTNKSVTIWGLVELPKINDQIEMF